MDLGIKGKVALVAASSQGLGKAVAMGLAREGVKIVICARGKEALEATRAEIHSKTSAEILSIQADLTKYNDIKNLVATATKTFGTIHILINNAGGPPPGYFWNLNDDHWQKGFELTLMSSVRLTREVLPFMRQQKWGRIINITSVSVKQPIDNLILSNSLRLGVVGWAKTVSSQVASEGILINNVCPGWTRTNRVDELLRARAKAEGSTLEEIENRITSEIPIGRMGQPEEFANLVVFLASERASYITGTSIQVDGGTIRGIY